jgi:hypothetical protein
LPDTSVDGRYVGSVLKTDVRETPDRQGEGEAPRPRWRVSDIAFFLLFAVFFASVVAVVLLGVFSVLAAGSASMHQSFHEKAFGTGPLALRIYNRMADAAHPDKTGIPTGLSAWLAVAFSALNLALAVFLLWLRPRDRTARLLAVGMVGTAAVFNLASQIAIEIQPLLVDETIGHVSAHIITGGAYTFALLTFPDGRLVPRWRPWTLALLYSPLIAAVSLLPLRVEGNARPGVLLLFFGLVVPVAGVLSQAYRFRRSDDPAEHQQARLLFWALLPALGVGIWFLVTQGFSSLDVGLAGRHLAEQPVAVFRVFQPVFLLVPLALFLGLLRYRLWDIDRVVNRTLVYGLATGIVFGLGLSFVILLQRLLRPITAENGVAVAVSTLAAFAAFTPVRRRIQDFIDRRFYRHRYDAQKTIDAFTSRLRDQLDLEALAFELREAVVGTMQPSQLSLLVRGTNGRLEWQWTYRGRGRERDAAVRP